MDLPITVFVNAHTLEDTITAFALLRRKLDTTDAEYRFTAAHGGTLATAWVINGVGIEQIATALTVATDIHELAELTLDEYAPEMCTKGSLTMLLSEGNAWSSAGEQIISKRHFGCHRDLCEAIAASCSLPVLLDGVCRNQRVSIHNATSKTTVLPNSSDGDIDIKLHSHTPRCMRTLRTITVEEVCGLFYMATQKATAEPPPPSPESSETRGAGLTPSP